MKILKIFGAVVGIHVFALILIFANPGCSSPNKAAPSPADTVSRTEDGSVPASASPSATNPGSVSPISVATGDSPVSPAPSSFDPNAPAATIRFSPTRPGTAAASTLEAQPVADVTPASTYTVAKGDSLWTIAKKHHLSVSELTVANNLKASSTVRVGQKLIIPARAGALPAAVAANDRGAKAAPAQAAPTPHNSGESVKHVVKPGETLGAIARKYQVKVGEIATANNISDPAKIRPGMELTIPGWQAPSGRSSHATARPAAADTAAPAASAPVVAPAPEQDLDAGLKTKSDDAPVIKVENQ